MRIGIVNDMSMAREALRRVVASVPGLSIAWTAHDGLEALERAREDRPDLILMDLIMPGLDGVEATRLIMATNPCPILVVTATVSGHLGKVYEAMGHGALDAVDTPVLGSSGRVQGVDPLVQKIATVGKLIGQPISAACQPVESAIPSPTTPDNPCPLVLLGASTGGPNALAEILVGLPKDFPASMILVQHIDLAFAPGLATWLVGKTGHRVELIAPGQEPAPGRVLLAATNDHLVMTAGGQLDYTATPLEVCFRPSLDVFYSSVARHGPEQGVAVLLTGLGRDGAEGLLRLRNRGWHTIAQDTATSVVAGMPQAAAEIGAAVQVLPLNQIAGAIHSRTRCLSRTA
jgi:two-component system response regulator WspF